MTTRRGARWSQDPPTLPTLAGGRLSTSQQDAEKFRHQRSRHS